MRLVDADAFKQQFAAITIKNNLDAGKCNAMCQLIDKQPTAYDPDKIMEQIKQTANVEIVDDDYYRRTGQQLKAITVPVLEKIIKAGGIDEQ